MTFKLEHFISREIQIFMKFKHVYTEDLTRIKKNKIMYNGRVNRTLLKKTELTDVGTL